MKKTSIIFVVLVFLCAIIIMAYNINQSNKEKLAIEQYDNSVVKYSFSYNIDANLILAVIKAESKFKETALSSKGAMGLMQILPSTGEFIAKKLNEDYIKESLYSFDTNIKYGTFYLMYLFNKFDNIDCVLSAYNAGEGNVSFWLTKYSDDGIHLNNIPFKETENYVKKVKEYYKEFKNKYNY